MFFPVSLGVAALALASSVSATVYDITVGDQNGDTVFTPEAIVRACYYWPPCFAC